MSDDDLTIGQKLRSAYFVILTGLFVALLGVCSYGFVFSRPPYSISEFALYALSIFGLGAIAWLVAVYLELVDPRRRKYIGDGDAPTFIKGDELGDGDPADEEGRRWRI